jgi:hypothetical protein
MIPAAIYALAIQGSVVNEILSIAMCLFLRMTILWWA